MRHRSSDHHSCSPTLNGTDDCKISQHLQDIHSSSLTQKKVIDLLTERNQMDGCMKSNILLLTSIVISK
jgi:hypothetical protein